jgi:hypothetical protein
MRFVSIAWSRELGSGRRRIGRSSAPSIRASVNFEFFERRVMLSAAPVVANIDSLGFGTESGVIGPSGTGQPEVEVFQYDAPVTQTLDIHVQAKEPLASATISIFSPDGSQLLYAPGDPENRINEVRFPVVAGMTYDVDVTAGPGSVRPGQFQLAFDDFSDQQANAFTLSLASGATSVELAGAIDPVGDIDWFQVSSPINGLLTASLGAGSAGSFLGQVLVRNAAGTYAVSDQSAAAGAVDSAVTEFQVQQGQTYFIEVTAASSVATVHQKGTYLLTASFQAFAAGHGFATATPLSVSPSGAAAQNSFISTAGVADYYRYVAPQSTAIVVREEEPPSGHLDTLLTVYDALGQPLPGGTDDDADWLDSRGFAQTGSQVRVSVDAGKTYFIEAGAFDGSTGPYNLSVTPDGANDSPATAMPLVLSPQGSLTTTGLIFFPGDVQFYRFVAPIDGEMSIQQDAQGSPLDSDLTILDSSERLLTFDDDSDPKVTGNGQNSLVQFPVVAGRAYYVEAAGYPNLDGSRQTGGFKLIFATNPNPPPDDQPDTFAKAQQVDVSSGFARLTGTIDSGAEVNVFKFVAPFTESIQVELAPAAENSFQGYLFAFDDTGTEISNDYTLILLSDDTMNLVQFDVVAGGTYYVQVAAYVGNTGAYDLRLQAASSIPASSQRPGATFATAINLELDSSGAATVGGTIDEPGGADVYRFEPNQTETLTIRQFAAPGSRLDTLLLAFSDAQTLILEDDDTDADLTSSGTLNVIDRNSAFLLPVIAGKTYYLKAASAGSTTGAYFLALSPAINDIGDEIGGGPASVQEIPLSDDASGTQLGVIEMPGDLDAFRFTAPLTGLMTVTEQAAAGSNLDSQLFAFDSQRQPLANNNDFYGTFNSLVQFNVLAGQTYYLKAAAYGTSVGAYVLALNIQPPSAAPGHSFATAIPLSLSASAPSSQIGSIVAAGDADVYLFVAPASGLLTVRQQAGSGSPLDSYLYAFDGSQPVNNFDGLQALLASNDDSGGTLDSLIQFHVTAGHNYYVRAAGFGTSIGKYVLTISYGNSNTTAAVGHTFADAGPLSLDTNGYGSQMGVITAAGDADMYRFIAPYTGTLTIRQNAPSAGSSSDKFGPSKSILDSVLTVFDGSQIQIARNDDDTDDDSLDSYLRISIVAGQTYYVRAAGFGPTTGHYELLFNDDVPNDFADASLITVDSKLLSATQFGVIEVPTDVDVYRFVAPVTGPIDVTQQATGGSRLDSYLFLFDDSQTLIGSDDDETIDQTAPGGSLTIPDSLVQANVVAGQTYYIRAASSSALATDPGRSPIGAYRLELTFPAYDFGATFADARTILPPVPSPAAQRGNILQIGEVDMFQFAADFTGQVTFKFVAPPGIGPLLDPVLVAYDASGNEIARDPNKLTLGVQAHSLYFIQAGGYGASTGRFELDYSQVPGSGLGLDFGSAIPVALSGSGSATVRGPLGPPGAVSVFQFQATISGQTRVTLSSSSPGSLAAFTVSNGTPTQVGSDTPEPGFMTFDVVASQTYFVRLASTGFGGSFSLDLQTAAVKAPSSDIQLAGKFTLSQLGVAYVATVPSAGSTPSEQRLAADLITISLVTTFVASEHGELSGAYLLVWADPVDFVLTDAKARQSGYTAGRGPISEVGGSYNSGAGVLKLVIIPLLSSSYELDLIGVGEGSVLFGAAAITPTGAEVASEGSPGPGFRASLQSTTDLVVVLGFNLPDTPYPPGPVNPSSAPPPGPSVRPGPEVASSPVSSSFFGGALSSQATTPIGAFAGLSAPGGAIAEALAQFPAGLSTLTAPPSSIVTAVSAHANDEPPPAEPPNLFGQGGPAAAIALVARVANGDFQGLSPRTRTIVQPILRGLDSLGGRVWTVFKSIIINLSRPRIATKKTGLRGAFAHPAKADPVNLATVLSPIQDGRLDDGDFLRASEGEDRLVAPIRPATGGKPDWDGAAHQGFFVFVLTVTALRDMRASQPFPGRFRFRGRNFSNGITPSRRHDRRASFPGSPS